MNRYLLIVVFICLQLNGCGGEVKRKLIDQNRQAGIFISARATDPEIRQAGRDVEANSVEHLAWIGPPKESIEYNSSNSAAIRTDSKRQRESSWWFKIKQFFGGKVMEAIIQAISSFIPGWAGLSGLITFGWGVWKYIQEKRKVRALLDGVNGVMKAVKGGELSVSGAKSILKESQATWNVGKDIRKDLEALWNKNKLSKVKE